MHAELLAAAGGAAASVQAGQWYGFPLGATTRTACKPVRWDPWFLTERAPGTVLPASPVRYGVIIMARLRGLRRLHSRRYCGPGRI